MSARPQDIIGKGWRFPLGVDGRGGVALSEGDQDIEEAIAIILNTPKGLRLMRPEFGCRIHDLLFAPLNAATLASPNPLNDMFLDACDKLQLPRNADFNGASQDGMGVYQVTQKNGERHSAARAYLDETARKLPN